MKQKSLGVPERIQSKEDDDGYMELTHFRCQLTLFGFVFLNLKI